MYKTTWHMERGSSRQLCPFCHISPTQRGNINIQCDIWMRAGLLVEFGVEASPALDVPPLCVAIGICCHADDSLSMSGMSVGLACSRRIRREAGSLSTVHMQKNNYDSPIQLGPKKSSEKAKQKNFGEIPFTQAAESIEEKSEKRHCTSKKCSSTSTKKATAKHQRGSECRSVCRSPVLHSIPTG